MLGIERLGSGDIMQRVVMGTRYLSPGRLELEQLAQQRQPFFLRQLPDKVAQSLAVASSDHSASVRDHPYSSTIDF